MNRVTVQPTGAQGALRLVVARPTPAAPIERPAADDGDALRLFWYPLESDDEAMRGQLVGAAHRLAWAIDELRADARLPNLLRALEACEYHLENLAMRLFELRELLLDLTDLTGAPPDPRGEAVARVLALLDDALPVRDARAQRSYLHLNVRIGTRHCDPHGVARALRAAIDPAAERRRVQSAVRTAITTHADRAAAVLGLALTLLDPAA
jgi:hypothetical protein